MGAGNAGAGGSDAGFRNSVNTREKKANEKNLGTSDYQGDLDSKERGKKNSNNNGGEGGNSQPVIAKKTIGGNKIQTTEAKVEKAKTLTADEILLRNKKRGRSNSIMTSSKGVTKTSSDYSLGEATLLGRV